jgi:hypothetical protein
MRGALHDGVFFLHEDEWGMIDIMPIENLKPAEEVARDAKEFREAHFDGFGWTDLYVIPRPAHPLAVRQIPFAFVREVVMSRLPEAKTVESGIKPGEIISRTGFAFGEDDEGAMYGNLEGGIVQYLHFIPPGKRDHDILVFWTSALTTLGSTYRLMLADWWRKVRVDLSDTGAVDRYLQGAHT